MEVHRIGVLAMDGFVPFDLATAVDAFHRVAPMDGPPPYDVRLCGVRSRPEVVHSTLLCVEAPWPLESLHDVDTVVVPGIVDVQAPIPEGVLDVLVGCADAGARMVSICTGAFVLAACGLLDGKRATTHWAAAEVLQQRHPRIEVDPAVLYVDAGKVLTSAGATAGMDLCLHIIRTDLGAQTAAYAARLAVAPLERPGGQAQFIVPTAPKDTGSLATLLGQIRETLDRGWTVDAMASTAGVSLRTLNRRFRDQVGQTPARWLSRTRVARAQQLLESTQLSVDRVAEAVGFGAATTLRDRFRAQLETTPTAYRRAFRAAP